MTEDEMDGIIDAMDVNLSKLQEMVRDGKPGVPQSMGSQRVGYDLANASNNRAHCQLKWVESQADEMFQNSKEVTPDFITPTSQVFHQLNSYSTS